MMELGFSPQNFQAILPTIQTKFQIPEIEVTHSGCDDHNTLHRHGRGPCPSTSSQRLRQPAKTSLLVGCEHGTPNNNNEGSQCNKACISLTLPLEVELNVLGVVEQGVIDQGQCARFRRKRNSVPDLSHRSPPAQKERPRSYSSQADLRNRELQMPRRSLMMRSNNARSSTLCSTEL